MGETKEDMRYPYTYACDFIRNLAGYNEHGTKISRCTASLIRGGIAKVLNMEDRRLAELLADAEMSKSGEEIQDQVTDYLNRLKNIGFIKED